MIIGIVAVAIVTKPKAFNKGLMFVKNTDILLSGNKWTIMVNIALEDYSNLMELMNFTIIYVC